MFNLLWSKLPQVAPKSEGNYRESQPPSDNEGLRYPECVCMHIVVLQISIDLEIYIILHIYINTYKQISCYRLGGEKEVNH